MLLIVALFILIVAIYLLDYSRKLYRKTALPNGRLIYFDSSNLDLYQKILYDPSIGLSGKPDYVIKNKKMYIPVEIKSSRTPSKPHESHVYQLAAYCYLVEKEYGRRPKYGIIKYPQKNFAVDYTPALESAIINIVKTMQNLYLDSNLSRSHSIQARCNGCGYRETCDQRL